MVRPLSSSRSIRLERLELARLGEPLRNLRRRVARAELPALGEHADELLERLAHPCEVRREPCEVERPAVPGGQAHLAVERQQPLPHALQRGLQQRRLGRDLRLAVPRHLEQPRVLRRRGGLAGERSEPARLRLGVGVNPLVCAQQHAVHAVPKNDRCGHVAGGRRQGGEGGRRVRRVLQGRVRHAVVRRAHAPLGVGAPAHALARADRQRLGQLERN